jgi:hypothetical protein
MSTTRGSSSVVRGAAAMAKRATANLMSGRAAPGSKVGMTDLGNRAVASAPKPSLDTASGNNRTQIYTYFTKPTRVGDDIPVLYSGDRLWARVKLTLETAGPVAVGQSSQLLPVLSGKGALLPTGGQMEFVIAKGTRLYIASTSVNRVKVTIEPLPWLEQITASVLALVSRATGKE